MKPSKLLIIFALLISACSTMSREQYNYEYKTTFPNYISETLIVRVSGDNNTAGNVTTMRMINGVAIQVPTGEKGPSFNKKNQEEYGIRLAKILIKQKAFKATLFDKTNRPLSNSQNVLLVKFNKTYTGGDGWPTNLNATFTLSRAGKKVFEKQYKASSSLFESCLECYPDDIATKKLSSQFLKDLYLRQSSI